MAGRPEAEDPMTKEEEVAVIVVGAGPSGLATAACLSLLSIPSIILEREDCNASLWRRRAYDRLKLHLAKQFCALPHMPHADAAPTFISKDGFIRYLDHYVDRFGLSPVYRREVESASYDDGAGAWRVTARDTATGEAEEYASRFLVVATGENAEGRVPEVPGLTSFLGEVIHSSEYKSGKAYDGKSVLVVGSGNSGMEIAYDLSNFGARTSIAVRSPFHVLTKEMVHLGMVLLKYLPPNLVDAIVLTLGWIKYGDLSKHGIIRPDKGPFTIKVATGRSAVIDVGSVEKIKSGEIQVVKGLSSVSGNEVKFSDGRTYPFDAIVFATGYRSTATTWLKDCDDLLNKDGWPKGMFPNHWKGKNGLYCAGLSKRGLAGVSMDAQNIADDIKSAYDGNQAL